MFKLDSVFLFALDVVKGPYVHCSAPQGNGVAADVLAVATPLNPSAAPPAVWGVNSPLLNKTGTVSSAKASELVTPHSPTTSGAARTNTTHSEARSHSRLQATSSTAQSSSAHASSSSSSAPTRRHDEQTEASADNRFAGLSDVFIPRSEFSRRVLWLYPAETRLLYLYYPEEIPGDHYPRKTLRYSLCMAFRVDSRMVTVGKQLLNRLVQPYSMVLINVAEELRNAEVRFGYVSRGLENNNNNNNTADSRDGGSSGGVPHTREETPTSLFSDPNQHRSNERSVQGPNDSQFTHAPSPANMSMTMTDPTTGTVVSGPRTEPLQIAVPRAGSPARSGTFPAVLPSELNTPTFATPGATPGTAPSPLSSATFTSAMRGSTAMKLSVLTGLANAQTSTSPAAAAGTPHTQTNTAGQSSLPRASTGLHSGTGSASTASLLTPWTAATGTSTSSSESRCLNCFVTPNQEQQWVSLQAFFNNWYESMTRDTNSGRHRRPPPRKGRSGATQLRPGGGGAGSSSNMRDDDGAVGQSSSTLFLSPTSTLTAPAAAWQNPPSSPLTDDTHNAATTAEIPTITITTTAGGGSTLVVPSSSSHSPPRPPHSPTTAGAGPVLTARIASPTGPQAASALLPRQPSSPNGTLHGVFRGSVDTMGSAGTDMESTVYSPLVAYPKERHIGSWDRLARVAAVAAATATPDGLASAASALETAAQSALRAGGMCEPAGGWSTRHIIDAIPVLQSRWQLVQHMAATAAATTTTASTGALASPSAALSPEAGARAALNRTPTMLRLSDGIGFHVRRMAPLTPVKEVPLGTIPVLITTPDQRQLEKMDVAVQKVVGLIDGEHSVADLVFQLTFGTASSLYEVCHAAATQSPQLFGARNDLATSAAMNPSAMNANAATTSASTAAGAWHPHGTAAAAAASVRDAVHTATVIPGSESTMACAGSETQPSSTRGALQGVGVPEGSSAVSLDSDVPVNTGASSQSVSPALVKPVPALWVSSMQVQLRKLPQPSALFTRWAPTPLARVSVWHTAPRSLLEAAHNTNNGNTSHAGLLGGEQASHTRGKVLASASSEAPALFRAVLPVPSPSLMPTVVTPGAVQGQLSQTASLGASVVGASRTSRRANMSPLHLAAAGGVGGGGSHASYASYSHPTAGGVAGSVQNTPGSGQFAALPHAATSVSMETNTVSALTLPTVDVLRVAVDLPPVWHAYFGIVTEALLQLERCGMIRLLQPWAPHTTYRTTATFQEVLADRDHPAREAIGVYLLKCTQRSRHAHEQRRERRRRRAVAEAPSQQTVTPSSATATTSGVDRAARSASGTPARRAPRRVAPTRPATDASAFAQGGESAHATDPLTDHGAGATTGMQRPTITTTMTTTATAVGSLRRAAGLRPPAVDDDLDQSLRSAHSSTASLLSHALSYDPTGGTLRLSIGRTAVSTSHRSSPTMVLSASLGTHVVGFGDGDSASGSTSVRIGPLAHTLLPPVEPLFLSSSVPTHGGVGGSPMHGAALVSRLERASGSGANDVCDLDSAALSLSRGASSFDDDDSSSSDSSSPSSVSSGSVSRSSSPSSSSASSRGSSCASAGRGKAQPASASGATPTCTTTNNNNRDAAWAAETAPSDASAPTLAASDSLRDDPAALSSSQPNSPQTIRAESFTETEIRATASAALCALGKFTNTTIHRVQQEMRWMPMWARALDAWSPMCCRALVELALLNDWVEVVN